MKALLKYSGVIIQLIGVILLLVPKFMGTTSNVTLVAGGSCIALGVIVYVVINRIAKG